MRFSYNCRNIALGVRHNLGTHSFEQSKSRLRIPTTLFQDFKESELFHFMKVLGIWSTGATVFFGWTFTTRYLALARARHA